MKDQNVGTVTLPARSSEDACLAECKKHVEATGCEYHKGICAYHSKEVASGSGVSPTTCWFKSGIIKIKHHCQQNVDIIPNM